MPMPPVSTSSANRSSNFDQMGDAVAGHAGRGIDDGKTLAGEPVENARFAHVGPADDDNLRDTHNSL